MTDGDDGSPPPRGPSGEDGGRDDESAHPGGHLRRGDPPAGATGPDRRGPDRPLGGRDSSGRAGSAGPNPRDGLRPAIAWAFSTDHGSVVFVREILVSVLVVTAIGFLLFAVSGVWPPLVAVESGSMEPHLHRGDLVFVMDEQRLAPDFAVAGTGVVTQEVAGERGYERFGEAGDVIVYRPFGSNATTPVIHRAHFFVEEGEDWYERTDPAFVQADSCEELRYCPAPYDGFITKGDNDRSNNYYDQARGISTPVKSEWVRGRAVVRVPWLGWVRLAVSEMQLPGAAPAVEVVRGTVAAG